MCAKVSHSQKRFGVAQQGTQAARQKQLIESAGAESRRETVADPEVDEIVREDSFAAVSARLETLDAFGLERAAAIIHEMTAAGGFSIPQVKYSGKKLV